MKKRKPIYMMHKHHASKLHYDLRLEIGGILKSWALKELPLKPNKAVLAILVPDHPFWYRHFEGVIPEGRYGAGPVIVWDKGLFTSFYKDHQDKLISIQGCIENGLLLIWIEGKKLNGGFALLRISKKQRWLMIKLPDEHVLKGRLPENWDKSVKSNKTIEEVFQKYLEKK